MKKLLPVALLLDLVLLGVIIYLVFFKTYEQLEVQTPLEAQKEIWCYVNTIASPTSEITQRKLPLHSYKVEKATDGYDVYQRCVPKNDTSN